MIEFCSQAYPELKGRLSALLEFIKQEKNSSLPIELKKKVADTSDLNLFLQPLRKIKERLTPVSPSKQKDMN